VSVLLNRLKILPAVKISLFYAGGILLGDRFSTIDPFLFLAVATLLLIIVLFFRRQSIDDLLFFGILLTLGAAVGSSIPNTGKSNSTPYDQQLIAGGKVKSVEYQSTERTVYLFQLSWILNNDQVNSEKNLVRLVSGKDNEILTNGTEVIMQGDIHPYPGKRNPGGRDLRQYFSRRNIVGWIKPQRQIVTQPAAAQLDPSKKIRQVISGLLPTDQANLLTGMILGDKQVLPEEVARSFRRSGLYHLLAVSGLHIGFFFVILLFIIRFLTNNLTARRLTLLAGLWFYVWITGANPPTLRAALMLTLIILSFFLRRVPVRWNLLASAAFIILIISPNQLFNAGFQLSFAAAAGVMLAVDFLDRERLSQPDISRRSSKIIRTIRNYLFEPAMISLFVMILTAPLLIWHFEGYAPIAICLNVVAVPIAGLIFSLTWCAILLKLLAGFSLSALTGAIESGLKVLNTLAEWGAIAPGNAASSYGGIGVSLAILITFLTIIFMRTWRYRIIALLTGLMVIIFLPVLTANPFLRVDCFDVGQGDAALITCSDNSHLMIDCSNAEAAKFELIPVLKHRNVHRIENLAISHFDVDHAGGALELMQEIQIGRIITTTEHTTDKLGNEILHQAAELNIPVVVKCLGDTLDLSSNLKCLVLWPLSPCDGSENEHSLTLRLSYGNTDFLFTGDIGKSEEKRLNQAGQYLHSEFLKIPHHGSKYSSHRAFLETVSPDFAFISVGGKNPFGHPANRVVSELITVGSNVHRSDQQQAAVYQSDGKSVWPIQWK